jgi:tRNA-dihydrouridine synthase B
MKLCLAPILGHTDFVFRNAQARNFSGIDAWYCPFITTVSGKTVKDTHIRDLLPKYNKLKNIVPQLIGKDAEEFIVLANQLYSIGYHTINWNLGCPYPMVVNKKRGAGLLPHPELISNFLDKVIPSAKCRISIKMRLGKDDPEDIFRVLPVLNNYPLEEIIIHPRTAQQMYGGSVDLNAFEKCLLHTNHPVVYNGDIVKLESYEKISRRFPSIKSIMIGRGILMNPAFPELIKQILPKRYSERLYRFHEDLVRGYQENGCEEIPLLGKLKQIWCYLAASFSKSEEIVLKIQRTKTLEKYWEEVKEAFEGLEKQLAP